MMKRSLFLIIIGIFLFLLFDLILIYLLFSADHPINSLNIFKEKQFEIDPSSGLNISLQNNLLIKDGNPKSLILKRALIYAQVMKPAYLNNEVGGYILPVSISTKKSDIKTLVYLRNRLEDKISILSAENGYIPAKQTWFLKSLEEIIPLLRKGDPIIFSVWLEKPSDEFFRRYKCDSKCRDFFRINNAYIERNNFLVSNLKSNLSAVRTYFVGPVTSMIIYEN